MKNKIIVMLIIAAIGLSVGFGTNVYQKSQIKNELDVVKMEVTSYKESLNQKDQDVQKNMQQNKILNDALQEANQTIDELKDNNSTLVYLGDFKLSHYCDERRPHICGGSGVTASGSSTKVGRTVAVDPKVIPYGTKIYIEGYGWRTAEDCGSWVNNNHIDILVNTHAQAEQLGITSGGVWILVENS